MARRRTDEERLVLAHKTAHEVVLASKPGVPMGVTLLWHHETGASATIREPGRADLRDLLVDVRLFDDPAEDLELRSLFAAARRVGVEPRWIPGLDDAEADHAKARAGGAMIFNLQEQQADGSVRERRIYPPEAFSLWINTEHFHRDPRKEAELARMGELAAAALRSVGQEYLHHLLTEIEFVHRMSALGLTKPLVTCELLSL
jgi:hypothetical protein